MKLEISNSTRLEGDIYISGSKNAILPEMVLCLLTDEEVNFSNVPNITDVMVLSKILQKIGVKVTFNKELNKLSLKRRRLKTNVLLEEVKSIRASYYIMGALFKVVNKYKIYYPGGCNFDKRPINFHLDALRLLGGKVYEKKHYLSICSSSSCSSTITLPVPSVGATINIILASCLITGITTIVNPSLEPEVLDFILAIKKMGAKVIVSSNEITITGVNHLRGLTHSVMSDRIEAGSYMLLASSALYASVYIHNISDIYLTKVIEVIKLLGVNVEYKDGTIHILKDKQIKGITLTSSYYPMFPTDLQQILVATLLSASSVSIINDLVYPKRFSEVPYLVKMKGLCLINNDHLLISPSKLIATSVLATDLRAGFALIIAGCMAKGKTVIDNAEVLLRGYDNLVNKILGIGVEVTVSL